MKTLFITALILLSLSLFAGSQTFEEGTTFQVAFSPKAECQNLVINAIDKAQKKILAQAYSFSAPIVKSILNAYKKKSRCQSDIKPKPENSEIFLRYILGELENSAI